MYTPLILVFIAIIYFDIFDSFFILCTYIVVNTHGHFFEQIFVRQFLAGTNICILVQTFVFYRMDLALFYLESDNYFLVNLIEAFVNDLVFGLSGVLGFGFWFVLNNLIC